MPRNGIASGRARSEIVKTHLTVPLLARFVQEQRFSPQVAGEKTNSSASLNLNSSENPNLNSSEISTGGTGRKDANHDEKKISNSAQDVIDLGDLAAPRKQGGGLASHFVKAGFKSV